MFRIGFGYDVHRLMENRPLILGGVQVPHPWGLDGHSDADVLTHAVMDGVLGALGAGDIGQHFPDTDPRYKDVSSLSMLKTVMGMVKEKGFQVNNVDATIVAQAPRLASYLSDMEMQLAALLEVPDNVVNVKATTSERLGFCGRGEGMEAFAVISLLERNP
ncbi:MAG: 2-C-methyl-D-erythritol 2,4-cyclodiphosphate synthase [Desulfobacteraceae bacterium]